MFFFYVAPPQPVSFFVICVFFFVVLLVRIWVLSNLRTKRMSVRKHLRRGD
jgi:hypothetical protein